MTWTVLAITLAIQAMISAAALSGPVLAPDISASTGLRATLVGVQVGLIYGAAAVSSLLSGNIIRQYGAVRVSQVALVLAGCGLLLSLVSTVPAFIGAALLIGLGYGVVTPASSHLLSQSTPRHHMGLVFSLKQTGVPLGGILAALALPPLAYVAGWKGALATFAVMCILVAIAAEAVRAGIETPRIAGARQSNMLQGIRTLLANATLRSLALTSFVFAAMQLILTGFLVTFLTEGRGLPLVTAAKILAIAQAGGVGGRLLWGWSADRFLTPRRVLAVLAALSSVCAIIFSIEADIGQTVILALVSAVFGAAAIGWNGVFLAEVARLAPPDSVGSLTGAALFMTYAGVVVGPPAFAIVLSHADYATAFAVVSAVMAVMAAILFIGGNASHHTMRKVSL